VRHHRNKESELCGDADLGLPKSNYFMTFKVNVISD